MAGKTFVTASIGDEEFIVTFTTNREGTDQKYQKKDKKGRQLNE